MRKRSLLSEQPSYISSLEQTEAEKGISPKWFYTGKANFWIPRTIFEY